MLLPAGYCAAEMYTYITENQSCAVSSNATKVEPNIMYIFFLDLLGNILIDQG